MRRQCRAAVVVLISTTALSVTSSGAEIRIALAPKIMPPNDRAMFEEDPVDFYGTNMALLTSTFLRGRVESQLRKPVPSSLRVQANRLANTSIITIAATGADDSMTSSFLSALFDQFVRYKREQKEKYYREAINRVDVALSSVSDDYVPALKKYREQLVIASLLDVKSDFEKIEY